MRLLTEGFIDGVALANMYMYTYIYTYSEGKCDGVCVCVCCSSAKVIVVESQTNAKSVNCPFVHHKSS